MPALTRLKPAILIAAIAAALMLCASPSLGQQGGGTLARSPHEYSRAVLRTPDFAPVGGDGIVALNIVPAQGAKAGDEAKSQWLTFGQAFARGDLSPDQPLAIAVGDDLFALQRDIKALHEDGSVRHAVLTADLSDLSPRRHRAVLVRAEADPAPAESRAVPGGLNVSVTGRRDGGEAFSGSLEASMLERMGEEAGAPWLSGPFVRERTISREIGPLLRVRADIRTYTDGDSRVRVVFENHKTFAPGPRDMTYDVAIAVEGITTLRLDRIRHYRGANWSRVLSTGGAPAFLVQHDPAYLADALAILPYDLSHGVSAGAIERNADALALLAARTATLSQGLLEPHMPAPGGRQDIGPLPAWDVLFLKSQNEWARAVMLRMADIAGSVPWHFEDDGHFEDDATGLPVRVDRRELFWAEKRGTEAKRGADRIPPAYFAGGDGGFTLDTAHKPLLSYTAYLVTGDAYHARELRHEAAFAIAMIWPELRHGTPVVTGQLQLRERAWSLRDAAAAAWLLPDSDPLKDYFEKARDASLEHMARVYLEEGRLDAAGETEGWFEAAYAIDGATAPWQNDFMVMILAQEALRGSAPAWRLVEWAENYQTGRFLDTGADPALGAAYAHIVSDPRTDEPVGSWARMLAATRGHDEYTENYPDHGVGYVVSAYAALSMIHRVTGSTRAVSAMEALAETQKGSRLFDPANRYGVHVLPQFLIADPYTD